MLSNLFRQKKLFSKAFALCLLTFSIGIADEVDVEIPQAILTLQEAYDYALTNNLRVKVEELEIGIREAETLQVGLHPNPILGFSVDGPSGSNWGFYENNDISLGITQLFELAGKRKARVRVAEAAQCETNWSFEITKCDLYAKVMHAFIKAAVAQEMLKLAHHFQSIAEQSYSCICEKTSCGKAPLLDLKKSEVELKMSKLALNKRFANFQKAKSELASLWNCTQPQFGQVEYELFKILPPLPYNQLSEELENSPELSRAHAEVSKAWEILQLQQKQKVPDVAMYLGVSTTRNFHDPALSVGVTIPIPLFDRNQGNIARADLELNQLMIKQNDLVNQLQIRLKTLYREWSASYRQVIDLKEVLDSVAEETYSLAEERYQLGKSDFLNFLDARTTLYNIRQQYLEAVEEYHHKRAEIMQLLAKCCSEVF